MMESSVGLSDTAVGNSETELCVGEALLQWKRNQIFSCCFCRLFYLELPPTLHYHHDESYCTWSVDLVSDDVN